MLKKRTFGIVILVVGALAFSFIGCGEKENGDSELSGNVTITPNTNVMAGMKLTAAYSGSDVIGWQWKWKRNGTDINSNGLDGDGPIQSYIPHQSGSYTATIISGGAKQNVSKTSAPVNVAEFTGTGGNIVRTDEKAWRMLDGSGSVQGVGGTYVFQQNNNYSVYIYSATNPNGEGFVLNDSGTWSASGSTLTLVGISSEYTFTYSVVSDNLILSDGSGGLVTYEGQLITIRP